MTNKGFSGLASVSLASHFVSGESSTVPISLSGHSVNRQKQLNMTRKAILIGSPGPKDSERHLKGVDIDLHHFVSFLKSPIGGSWEDNEIASLHKYASGNLIELFQNMTTDFLLVYFSGHGHQELKETNIAINDFESISISQLLSLIKAPKALIIIDTCRKVLDEGYSSFSGPEYLSFNFTSNHPKSSETYKEIISQSKDGIVIAYACSVGEISNDTELGGSYTYSLLATSLQWYESQNSDGVIFMDDVNNFARQYLKSTFQVEQNPQIRTTNNEDETPHFPFALRIASKSMQV